MITILIILVFVFICFYNFYWKRRGLPPGPTPWPLVGNMLSLSSKTPRYDVFQKWKEQYGSIFTYWVGETPVVSITDFNLVRDTFIKDGDSYTGRNFFPKFQKILRDGKLLGLANTEGEIWKEQRRFTLHVLRNFGMGRNVMEGMIMIEVNRLLNSAQKGLEKGVEEHDLPHVVEICVASIINQLLFGYRFEGENEPEFYHLKRLLHQGIRTLGNPLIFFMNFTNPDLLRNFPYFKQKTEAVLVAFKNIRAFLHKQIAWHRHQFALEGDPEEATNYVQAFLMEQHKREEQGNVGDFTLDQLINACQDLWVAGQETTTNTTNFGILYLMMNPKVQKKMQEELDKVVGDLRQVSLNDRPNLSYTNAVCNETQRLCNLLIQSLFHRTTNDVNINGYAIKEGTTIVPQLSSILYDEKTFPHPEKFNPDRFIDENGQFKKFEELIPFSVGKRQCMGESLARNELFLFLANLFHEYKVTPADKNQTLEKINGFTAQPPPFKCCLERRIPIIV